MIYIVCCIRDIKADIFGQPFYQASIGMAQRTFSDSVNQAADNNLMYKHPEDFELYHVGSFDDSNCSFTLLDRPVQLLLGSNCVVAKS